MSYSDGCLNGSRSSGNPDSINHGFPRSFNSLYGNSAFSLKVARAIKKKTAWLRIRIMCQSGATYLSADCCLNESTIKICKLVSHKFYFAMA
jgi:hypothetical protein